MYNNTHSQKRHVSELSDLAQHTRRHTMTDAGAKFVAQVSDPFSDQPQAVVGLPDQTSGQSIIYDYRQELTIERPTGASADDNFDLHVAMMPVIATNTVTGATAAARHVSVQLAFGGLTDVVQIPSWVSDGGVIAVNTVPSGDTTFDPNLGAGTDYQFIDVPILVDPTVRSRCISIAYEVINETEELYRSGALTDYRVDADVSETQLRFADSVGNLYFGECLMGNTPPNSLAQAKQINGVTRDAREGSLVVGCLDRRDLDARFPTAKPAYLLENVDPAGVTAQLDAIQMGPTHGFADDATFCRRLPFLQSGTYGSGLAGRSKFRLVAHILVEVFPRAGSELMPIAKPAPAYDAMALELLSELQSQTLPGYPVSWNGLGKYTRMLSNAVKKYASPVSAVAQSLATSLGQPGIAAMIAKGRTAGRAAASAAKNHKKR